MDAKNYIKTIKVSDGKHDVFYENGVKIAEFIMDVDGYFKLFLESNGGFYESWILRLVCDKLDEVNKPWDNIIKNDLNIGNLINICSEDLGLI